MSLKKEYVRDGKQRIIGSVTSGFSDTSSVVRNEKNQIIGRTSEKFHTTRDNHGSLVSTNSPRPRSPDRAQEVAPDCPHLQSSDFEPCLK
jgi:hypothetical protein